MSPDLNAISIRQMGASDHAIWTAMRTALWPEATEGDHARDIDRILASDDYWGFVAETKLPEPVAFAEIAIRKYANGCESQPVPFLEGIWVDARHRRGGIGSALVAHVERFVAARGFREIGSDALIENVVSHAAHAAWGFVETERVVCYRKMPIAAEQ
jgi:aminoglycoside 6'-N-acetyltransferase I